MFYLSTTYSRNSFKTVLDNWLLRSLHCRNNRATRSFLINTVSTMSKLLTPNTYYWSRNVSTMSKLLTRNTYYWSRKTLVTIHWTHLRENDICAKYFCAQKKNFLLSAATSPHLMFINDVIVIKLTHGIQNWIQLFRMAPILANVNFRYML